MATQRTYIASLAVRPDYTLAAQTTNNVARKVAAVDALADAERVARETVAPQLRMLQDKGVVASVEFPPLTGVALITVPEENAGAAFDAIRGVRGLGRIVRDRELTLSEPAPMALEPMPATPSTDPVPPKLYWNVARVRAPQVWQRGVDGSGVTIGIVDSGADITHPAIAAKYRGAGRDGAAPTHDYNFVDYVNGKTVAYDDHGHGTHVSGTATGGTPERLIGVAPGAQFITAKVFNKRASGNVSGILKGLSWMLAPRDASGNNPDASKAPDIISNSWGDDDEFGRTLAYLDIWKAFDAAGIVKVAAAGNNGPAVNAIDAPGSYASSITVTATDEKDQLAPFASRGLSPIKNPDGTRIFKPDIAAPGASIVSSGPKHKYYNFSGTSMATPAVAGVVALLLSKYPHLSNDDVRALLVDSAHDFGAKGPDAEFGYGFVDADAALTLADARFGSKTAAKRM